jgi:hypothetical protein
VTDGKEQLLAAVGEQFDEHFERDLKTMIDRHFAEIRQMLTEEFDRIDARLDEILALTGDLTEDAGRAKP